MFKKILYYIYDYFTLKQRRYIKFYNNLPTDQRIIDEFQLQKIKDNPLIQADSWKEFLDLPITTKKDLPQSPAMGGKYKQHETSGSTGQPRIIWVPNESWSRKDAIFSRSWKRMGRKDSDWVFRLISGEPQYAFYDWLRNVKPMNYKTIGQEHVDWVVKNKPFLIHGPGGAIRQLCELIISQGYQDILKDIKIHWCSESSAGHKERLIPFVKEFHEQYGLAELPTVCATDGYQNLQVLHEMGVIEVLDDMGHPVYDDEEGYIVVTDFNNTVTPIVRYKSGDRAKTKIITVNGCSYKILYDIIGRGVDYYSGPEVKKAIGWWVVAPISHILGDCIEKWRCQIEPKNGKFILFYKKKKDFPLDKLTPYKNWIRDNVGLSAEFVEIDQDSDEKYDIYWKNKLVKVVL